ncbi:MAG TPA: hypothetical protein VK982_00335, partial [Bacteroidales bacterium]|nr:hypothetical protein [Bacteroidales bacterium]
PLTLKLKLEKMKASVEQIINYIKENINLMPNTNYTIYKSCNGLTHTTGSMELRDKEYKEIMTFFTMDEVPEDDQRLSRMVKFQHSNQIIQ